MALTRAALLYRGGCGRCRVLSRVLALVSLGALRREPLAPPVADALAARHRAKLLLLWRGRLACRSRAALMVLTLALPRWAILLGLLRAVQ